MREVASNVVAHYTGHVLPHALTTGIGAVAISDWWRTLDVVSRGEIGCPTMLIHGQGRPPHALPPLGAHPPGAQPRARAGAGGAGGAARAAASAAARAGAAGAGAGAAGGAGRGAPQAMVIVPGMDHNFHVFSWESVS